MRLALILFVLLVAYALRLQTCKKCGGRIETYNGRTYRCTKCGERQ